MVTRASIKKAKEEQDKWIKEHPDASLKQRVKQSAQATKEALELEIGIHTLPSVITPIPEEHVKQLKQRLKR